MGSTDLLRYLILFLLGLRAFFVKGSKASDIESFDVVVLNEGHVSRILGFSLARTQIRRTSYFRRIRIS